MMALRKKRILLIDEECFSRICSALLMSEGYGIDTVASVGDLVSGLDTNELGLIITSYPYGSFLFEEIKRRNIPTLILSDQINKELITTLEGLRNSYCMIKPLDYWKFRNVVKQVMSGDVSIQGGYNIV